ncbi:MAG: response regulator [Gammaproteobacteria bacterium]
MGETVVRALHNLKGSAAIADLPDVLGIAAPLEDFVRELVENDESDEAVYPILAAGIHAIRACLAALREGNDPAAEMDRFHDMLSQGEAGFGESATSGEAETKTATADHAEREATQGSLRSVRMTIELPEHVDPEVLEIFHEEAEELLESIDRSIQEWLGDRTNGTHLDALLRALHTLKGGARLAGLTLLGDYTHRFESHLIEQQPNVGNLDDAFFVDLQSRHDLLVTFVTAIRSGAPGESIVIDASIASEGDEAAAAASADTDELGDGTPVDDAQRAAEDNVIPFATREAKESDVASSAMAQSEQVPVRQAPQEMVRVASTLLDDLVNLAGETSIHRARVEQEIRDFGDALDETETTIERLRDQLRRLELETDAQVLSRRERADGPGYTEFDPLEMDRYSQLQQLSRSLLESATDLVDLKETLAGKRRDAEALLAHQARINTELQEGLMRTRMVPFERLVPRLRRIVRQIGRELNKDVTFEAFDAEGELDRNVLERMIPPLEHMLRNAVDHGIESPEEREAAGKPAKGNITLRLSREGGDIVMEIADDGRGVDVERVREKAVQLGLMPEDADLKDDDIVQFIMAPGFSTAESVTQISGRGVGMDVAVSEVKMLGGEISIASEPGKGAKFTVRLPFTVSVNRALMVLIGEDTYAIPLNTIEGIVRVLPKDLEPYLEQSAATFEYAGERYRMRYLGSYVGREQYTRSDALSVPVLLVRSGDEAVALYVDAVQGSREIVVKGLGPQFASVGGVSGATILGDGSVVVILDPPSLIRAELAARLRPTEVTARREDDMSDRLTRVMVVDDSVTVRKVTSRVLERNGFEVMLAKDGVDAIAMLHQRQPDIMLLDIEMPRMDGFEVARQVRRDDRLKNLPIVIISSRTGAKHQERARELGVNVFLGKPFQETELMRIINELVG